jgi:hypothetical protein
MSVRRICLLTVALCAGYFLVLESAISIVPASGLVPYVNGDDI